MKPLFSSAENDKLAKALEAELAGISEHSDIYNELNIDPTKEYRLYQRACEEIDQFASNLPHDYKPGVVMADIKNVMLGHVMQGKGQYEFLFWLDNDDWTQGGPLLDEIMEYVVKAVPPNYKPAVVYEPYRLLMIKEVDSREPGSLVWKKDYVLNVSWLAERYFYHANPRVFKAIFNDAVKDANAFVLTAEILAAYLNNTSFRSDQNVVVPTRRNSQFKELDELFYRIDDEASAQMRLVVVGVDRLDNYIEEATQALELNEVERPVGLIDFNTAPPHARYFLDARAVPRWNRP